MAKDATRGLVDVECIARRGSWAEGVSMAADAAAYCASQPWCPGVRRVWWGLAVPPLFGVYLCELTTTPPGTEVPLAWSVAGQFPLALFFVDGAETPVQAIARYCLLITQWCERVYTGWSPTNVFPFARDETPEVADEMMAHVDVLKLHVIDSPGPKHVYSTSDKAPLRNGAAPRVREANGVKPGMLVVDSRGNDGVVVEESPCPDAAWFDAQDDRRLARHRDAKWWRLFAAAGGAVVAPEPLLQVVGFPTRTQHAIVWRNANDIARKRVEALLGEPPF